MNKTNDVQKVREREGEEGERARKMGQSVFLLYFHLRKSSLGSLFPEHGRLRVCARACPCVFIHTFMCKITQIMCTSMHACLRAHEIICECVQWESSS